MLKKLRKNWLKRCNNNFFANMTTVFVGLSFAYTVSILPAYSQQIIIDGKTNTTINTVNSTTTNVTTSTIKNNAAFNSFLNFNVYPGKIVNLVVPQNTSCLINLVHSTSTRIDGVLNSISNGHIGGNIFLINPFGITIGSQGTINVGSLNAQTPTASFVNGIISDSGDIDDASVSALLNGTTPISPDGKILVNGTINALGSVTLDAGEIVHTGQINAGPSAKEAIIETEDLLNLDKVSDQDNLTYDPDTGYISLKAIGNVDVQGIIKSDGAANINAGNVSIKAGNNIKLQKNSLVSAKGVDENSDAGDIYVFADNKATFGKNSVLDARGGNISGDGGFIELSAKNNVTLEGGSFKAKANDGKNGEVLIDPDTIDVLVDNLSDGVDINYVADVNIMVDSGVTISSRDIVNPAAGNHLLNASEGDSGNISFTAPEIEIKPGAKILSFANAGFNSGDITFTASKIGYTDAESKIKIDSDSLNPTILKGNNITLTAEAQDTYEVSFDDILTPASNATATAYIGSYAQVTASNNIIIDTNTYAESKLIILTLPVAEFNEDISANAKPVSTAYIGEYSNITATGDININAKAEAKSFVETIFFTPPANTIPEATAYIGNNATITSNTGEINIKSEAIADSYSLKTAKPSGAFSKTDVLLGGAFSKANATPEATSYVDNSASVNANDPNTGDINITSTTTATSSANSFAASLSTKESTIGVTVPIANSIPFSTSYIGDNANINAGHNLTLSSINTAEANSIGVYGTLATNDKGIGGSIAISNTSTDTALGEIIAAALGGLVAAPGTITECIKENDFKDYHSKSYIGNNSTIIAGLNVDISASDDFTADADAAVMSGSGKGGAAGAVAYSDSNPITIASINQGANVTSIGGQIQIISSSKADSSTNADAGAISAEGVGVGATVSLAKARPDSKAYVGENSTINATNNLSGDIIISSSGEAITDAKSIAGAGGGNFAGGASVGIAISTPKAKSYTLNGSILTSGNDISLLSFDKSESTSLAIFGVLAKDAGAGATNATSIVDFGDSFNSTAYVGSGSLITAGNNLYIKTNSDDDDYDSKASSQSVAGAIGGKLGLAGASSDSLVDSKTNASISDGATTTAENIIISARNKSDALSSADAGAAGAYGGLGAALTISRAKPISTASIGKNSQVNANNDIEITSTTKSNAKYADDITTFNTIAGAGAGAFAGGASVSISEAVPQSEVFIDTNSNVTAGNDIRLTAKEKTLVISRSGFAAIAGNTALGASVSTATTGSEDTINSSAYIASGATVVANNNIELKTNTDASDDDPNAIANSHAIAGAAGGSLGLAAAVATSTSNTSSRASIEDDATVTATTGSIYINANNVTKTLASADSAAVSWSAGVSAAVATENLNPISKAYVGKNSVLTAGTDIDIKSINTGILTYSNNITQTNALAGAGAGYFALGGAVSINNIGNQTFAFIDENAVINSQGNFNIFADSDFTSTNNAGNLVGGFVGIGASVITNNIDGETQAYIGKNTSIIVDNDIYISADSKDDSTAKTYSGQGGVISLGASVTTINSSNETKAFVDNNSKINKANNLIINANSESDVNTKSYGLTIGGIAAGASYAESNSGGTTEAYISDSAEVGIDLNPANSVNNVSLSAISDNEANAYSLAAAGGIYSGSGAVSKAKANPTIKSYIDDNAQVKTTGDISIKSQAVDNSDSESIGVSIGVASAGVSWSEATLDPNISNYIGDNTTINATGNITLLSLHNYGNTLTRLSKKAQAYSSGASAGALVGANAAYSLANADSTIRTYFGSNANIIGNNIEIISLSSNIADDEAKGKGGGLVAIGASISKAKVDSDNKSYVASNTNIEANNITISASSYNNVKADSLAGSGGVIAGAASFSETDIENDTLAYILSNDQAENKTITTNGNINILSNANNYYKAISDSSFASFVGASGARVKNDIESDVTAFVGKNLSINAGNNINIKANNTVSRTGSGYDLEAGAGGFAGGPAGTVDTDIDLITKAYIAGNDVKDPSKQIHADNDIKIESFNDVYTNESAKLTAGGAISWATVEVTTTADSFANSYLGNNTIINSGNDIYITSRGNSDVNTESKAKSSGVAGVAKAYTTSKAYNSNLTEVLSGVEIFAGNDLNVFAGKDSNGNLNNIQANAESRAWASGGIPVTKVEATAKVNDYNNINIASNSYLLSDDDINITSIKGSYDADAYARGEMKTYLLFGIPITFTTDGSRDSDTNTSSDIALNGYIRSGLGSQRYLYIKRDGSIANFSELIDLKENELAGVNIEETDRISRLEGEIKYLKELNDLNSLVTTDIEDIVYLKTQADDNFNPRNYLNDKKADLKQTLNDDIALLTPEEISTINDNIADIDRQLENYEGKTDAEIELVTVPIDKVKVGSGAINIKGNLSGNGRINAPGNHFSIGFMSDSIKNIVFNDLEIEKNVDGRIKINNATMTSNYGNITVNPGSSARKLIDVFNMFDPNDPRNPAELADKESHLLFNGDIFNINGDIKIKNNSGNIVTYGLIEADSLEITGNADFIHNYTPGIYDTAGNNYSSINPTPTIMAGNIIISAERININGLLQSGIDEYNLIIDADFDPDSDLYNEGSATDLISTHDSNLKAYWDGEKIQVYRAETKGGYIELNGEIISTGNGKLRVLDGYGTINIINNSDKDIVINDLNINERVDGQIVIRDNKKYYYYTGAEATTRRLNGLDSVVLKDEADREIVESEITRTNNPGVYNPDPNAHITEPGLGVRYFTIWVKKDYWYSFFIHHYYWQEVKISYTVPEYKFVAMANKPIDIEFSGRANSGLININSNNANVFIREDINNITGETNITGLGLYNMNNLATISAENINISTVNGIGTKTQAVRTDLQGGLLNAISTSGLINVEEIEGQMNIGLIATTGDVKLISDGSIYNPNLNIACIKGNNFDLTSVSGNIYAGVENNGTLTARANDDITINQLAGDLQIKRVESENNGNITLTANGSLLDVNDVQDRVSTQRLSEIWNELELTGQAALDRIQSDILIYKEQKKQEYITEHRIDETTFDDSYDPNYEYQLTDEEQRAFDNSIWTEEELSNSINGAALPEEISQLEIPSIVEETNVVGNDITLTASNGSIGLKKPDTTIEKARFESNSLTDEEKALLQNTDVQKIIINDDDVVILSSDALNIDNSGILNANSTKNIYIESDNDMKINVINAPEEVSLVALNGSIFDASVSENANIEAKDIILTANNGNIGLNTDDIDVLLSGELTLTAGNEIYIEGINETLDIIFYKGSLCASTRMTGTINIDKPNYDLKTEDIISLDSLGGDILLRTRNGNITLIDPEINANKLSLISDRGGISLLMNFDSYFDALAEGNIFINSASGDLNINSIRSVTGNALLIANNSILNGIIEANDIDLTANNGEINTTIESDGILTASAEGNIELTELTADININKVKSTSGNVLLTADNSIISGIVEGKDIRLTANSGEINTSLNSTGKITSTANQNIQLVELTNNLDLDSVISISGDANLVAENSIFNGTIKANEISLIANNGEINTTIDSNGQLTATAENNIEILETAGNIEANTVTSRSGNVTLTANSSLINGTVKGNSIELTATNGELNTLVDTNGTLTAGANGDINLTELTGDMNINSISSLNGNTQLIADHSIINGVITANNIDLTANNGEVNTTVNYSQAIKVYAENDIVLTKISNNLLDSNIISIISNTGDLIINVPLGNIDLIRPDFKATNLTLNADTGFVNLLMNFESILNINARDNINIYKEINDLNIVNVNSENGDASLIANNSILNGITKAKDINLNALNGGINTTIDSDGKLTANALTDINLTELTGTMDINLVKSLSGNALLIANNSILNGIIESNNIDLIANNGQIITSIDSIGIVNVLANNSINIQELVGDLNLDVAESIDGNILFDVINGSINDINGTNLNVIANNAQLTANNITNTLDFNVLDSSTINLTSNASISGHTGSLNTTTGGSFVSVDLNTNDSNLTVAGDISLSNTQSNGTFNAQAGGDFLSNNLTAGSTNLNISDDTSLTDTQLAGSLNAEIGGVLISNNLTADSTNLNAIGNTTLTDTQLAGSLDAEVGGILTTNNLTAGSTNLNILGDTSLTDTQLTGSMDAEVGGMLTSNNLTAGTTNLNIAGNTSLIDTQLTGSLNAEVVGILTSNNLTSGSTNITVEGDANFVDTQIGNNFTLTTNKNLTADNMQIAGTATVIAKESVNINGKIDGAINIDSYDLDLNLDSDIKIDRIAVTDVANITSFSGGSILDSNSTEAVNIFADKLNLVSSKDIGEMTNYLDVNVDKNLNVQSRGSIFLKEHDSLLEADKIESLTGSAYIESVDAGTTISYISAPDIVSVIANGDINIETIDPISVFLNASSGQNIKVQKGLASDNVEINADYIDVNFEDTTPGDPLNFIITGANNNIAKEVKVNATSGAGLAFSNFLTNNAIVNNLAPQTKLVLQNTQSTNQLILQSDYVEAINNINLNKLSIEGTSNLNANNVVINNTGDLTITDLHTNFAEISTTGDNLIIEKAIITDSGTLSNSTYIVLLENNGILSTTRPDLILKQDGIFTLKLDSSINIETNANIIASANELFISGAGDRPQINTDIALVTNELDVLTDQLTPRNDQAESDKKEKAMQLLGLEDPELYLDDYYSNYTYYFLELAVEVYNNSLIQKDPEDVAMKKAVDILQKANFNSDVIQKLLQKEPFNNNTDFVKLFENFLELKSVAKLPK